jgi:hypothetical protein
MALLNYTTKIEPEQTIAEIQKLLSKHGVSAMMTEYDGPHVAAVSFRMNIDGKPIGFKLPCNWRAVMEVFKKDYKVVNRIGRPNLEPQAIRTAWRIIFEWVRAQLALVEVNMVTVPQVFLPYAIMRDGKTLSEHVERDPSLLLGGGK